jgi:hypothetical protein
MAASLHLILKSNDHMYEVEPYESNLDITPAFEAFEYCLPMVKIEDLATSIGRYGIFNAILEHQSSENITANEQVWSGINGIGLVKHRSLFSSLNPSADSKRLNRNFNATQLEHWRSVIAEVKYSPFTYIYKAYLDGRNDYPTIAGFSIGKLVPLYPDDENIDWKPKDGEKVETAIRSIYYFNGLFPKS